MSTLTSALDGVLRRTTEAAGGVPGVVTILTDRQGTIHEGSAGVRAVGSSDAMTPDTILSLFSCTKAITGVALMQCVEDGLVSLDDRADRHVPEISRTQVLDGFDPDGTPRLRPPTTPITVRHLMLHTAGFGYEFFNADIRRYRTYANSLGAPRGTRASIDTPLTFDPGTRWQYGVNIDWVGLL
ncbi:MAG: class A beta-lactamase-related serine hydrolase, partial [Proteobacteria bacterium]|nr:class A beta-lactamase-related serine hydrolase [Pseudomonadota bacterium]